MRRILALTAAGLLAVLCVPAAVDAAAEATGTVRAVVKYKTNDGNEPLAGVEVFLGIGGSESMMGCTDERGVARFVSVPARTDLISATGVAVSPLRETDCMTNPDFRNPDNGRFMLTDWVDPFRVRAGETARIRFVVTTPADPGARRRDRPDPLRRDDARGPEARLRRRLDDVGRDARSRSVHRDPRRRCGQRCSRERLA